MACSRAHLSDTTSPAGSNTLGVPVGPFAVEALGSLAQPAAAPAVTATVARVGGDASAAAGQLLLATGTAGRVVNTPGALRLLDQYVHIQNAVLMEQPEAATAVALGSDKHDHYQFSQQSGQGNFSSACQGQQVV